jgi:hypothetical protein
MEQHSSVIIRCAKISAAAVVRLSTEVKKALIKSTSISSL